MLIVRLGFILMLLTSLAAGGLALLNNHTAPRIAFLKAQEQERARKEVALSVGATNFKKVELEDAEPFWEALDDSGKVVGYITMARGKGYSSTIETVCGFDLNWHITGIKITYQQETPGLGTRAVELKKGDRKPWFQAQFEGKDALKLAVVQDRGKIDSITGATITSRGVTNSVREAAKRVRAALETLPAETTEAAGGELSVQTEEQP